MVLCQSNRSREMDCVGPQRVMPWGALRTPTEQLSAELSKYRHMRICIYIHLTRPEEQADAR